MSELLYNIVKSIILMDFDTNFGLAIVAICLTVGGMVVLKVNQAMHLNK